MKNKKIPQRKCVATNEMKPKKDLIRIVRSKDGEVSVDPTGKKNGRGAYLTLTLDAIDKAQKNEILDRHLNTEIQPEIYDTLRQLAKDKKNEA